MFLGIDVGTGGTRALLIDRNGRTIASHASEHAPIHSKQIGWAEQDPEDWWRAATDAITAVIAAGAIAGAYISGDEIEAIGLTGQMHGCVMLDADGAVLRPALIWADQRTQPQCDWLTQKIGFTRLIELTANPALPNFTLTKLLWVRDHQPEICARIAHVLCPKDYVRYRLTGEFAMDMQEASGTLLLDVAHRRWSPEVAEAAAIPMSWLPRLFEGPEICARISPAGAAATGLSAGTPVAAGAGDQGAGAIGMGILTPGSVSATIGTSGVVFAATDAPIHDPLGRLHTFCHAAPNRWHVMGVTNGAGLSLRYFRDTFTPGKSYDELTALAAQAPPGSDCLLWAPYLFGERTPHLDPDARAAFIGITASHTQAHFIRAVLEGVAFSLRDTLTLFAELKIPVRSIRLGGGGARNPLWRQIQADVYGQPVDILEAEEGGAFGAALLAGTGAGAWPTVEAACAATIRITSTVNPLHTDIMNSSYNEYRKIYPALKNALESQVKMSTDIGVAVIGFGLGGRVFHAPFVSAVPGLKLEAIVQRKGDAAAKAYPNTRILRSVEEALADPAIQLVVVSTPNETHFALAKQALNAGKHVVIDKPFAATSAQARELSDLAASKHLVLVPFHNRRWDGDFLTVRKLLKEEAVGRLVTFESHFDRFRPIQREATWKEAGDPANGMLFDLGPHLVDQVLSLFGPPTGITASVRRDRDTTEIEDAFDIILHYPRMLAFCRASMLACDASPRFLLHGTHGSYKKYGLDPQEPSLEAGAKVPRQGSPEEWLNEPRSAWGTLTIAPILAEPGNLITTPIQTLPGDYRGYYANVRDAINGTAPLEVTPEDGYRLIRLLEMARESSDQGKTLPVNF